MGPFSPVAVGQGSHCDCRSTSLATPAVDETMRLRIKSALELLMSLIMVSAALTVIYRNLGTDGPTSSPGLIVPAEPLTIDASALRGTASAAVVMVVFADFQCPFCGRFAREVAPELENRYVRPGVMAMAFRHLPLPNHPQALPAARASECAGRQGRFWEMHDALFREGKLDDGVWLSASRSIGLDQSAFNTCLSDRSVVDKVVASAKQANALGIRATPAFLIGQRLPDGRLKVRRTLSGARPLDDFVREIEAVLGRETWFERLFARVTPK